MDAAMNYEIKLANGKKVEWSGSDGEDACRRAAACLGVEAVAWRYSRWEFVPCVHHSQIIG